MIVKLMEYKILAGVAAMLLTGGGALYVYKHKKPEYQKQEAIADSFFNTTPRIQERERVIIVYRDGNIEKETQILDAKGEVVRSVKETEKISGRVKRGGEIIRSGEELQEGDVLLEEIIEKDGRFFIRKEVLRDGKRVIEEVEIDAEEVEEVKLSRALEEERTIRERDGIREKIFIDEEGALKKIIQTLDEQGNVIMEEVIEIPEVVNGEIIDVEVIERDGVKIERVKVMRDGKASIEEKILDHDKKPQKIKLDSLIKIMNDTPGGLSEKDSKYIKDLREETFSSGEIVLIDNYTESKTTLKNQDPNFLEQGEPYTIASYPTDLSRKVTIDRIIPATLYTSIKSHLPSRTVTAQIEQDIVGGHGKKILIPAGSQAIGYYTPVTELGASRIGVSWTRIITPQGINIKFEGETNDAEGGSGINGEVDRRIKDKYLEAGLFSSISALMQYTVPVDDEQIKAAAEVFSTEIGGVTTELLRQSLSMIPRITIPKGTRITIRPLTDIWFKEPEEGTKLITARLVGLENEK
jgi:hypothetical protein